VDDVVLQISASSWTTKRSVHRGELLETSLGALQHQERNLLDVFGLRKSRGLELTVPVQARPSASGQIHPQRFALDVGVHPGVVFEQLASVYESFVVQELAEICNTLVHFETLSG